MDLDRTISFSSAASADQELLADIQGNILKGHGRAHTRNLFLSFDDPAAGRALVGELAKRVTSARAQEDAATGRDKNAAWSGEVFVSLLLTAAGYKALGIRNDCWPATDLKHPWVAGMAASRDALGDTDAAEWELPFRIPGSVHALLLLAFGNNYADEDVLAAEAMRYVVLIGDRARLVGLQGGRALRPRTAWRSVEHFGYADGISQPLFIDEDILEAAKTAPTWNAGFQLSNVLAPCSQGGAPGYGSYLAFRKLEQDIAGFASRAAALGTKLSPGDEARAGAMLIGRFEDGTPLAAAGTPSGGPSNDFDYSNDKSGDRCPFASHTRKVNPRDDQSRAHLFPRRGIPYDDRPVDVRRSQPTPGERAAAASNEAEAAETADLAAGTGGKAIESWTKSNWASEGLGLLFMGYNSDLSNQFEYMQKRWANDSDYSQPGVGLDPIAGQGVGITQQWPRVWGEPDRAALQLGRFVSLKGGEYFFAPPISFLKDVERYSQGARAAAAPGAGLHEAASV